MQTRTMSCTSGFNSGSTPGVFCVHLNNNARRLRLENYYAQSFTEIKTAVLNRFWIQMAVSLPKTQHGGFRSETAVTWPFQKRNGHKFIMQPFRK
jgi:hypothetical protein